MLSLIRIRNYAVVDEVELEFDQGMSVMTGETGAGKSILVDALGLASGQVLHLAVPAMFVALACSQGVPRHPAPYSRIAFGSCAFQWVEQPIFRAVVAAEPDLYLSLGDSIYGDFDGEKATNELGVVVVGGAGKNQWKIGDPHCNLAPGSIAYAYRSLWLYSYKVIWSYGYMYMVTD